MKILRWALLLMVYSQAYAANWVLIAENESGKSYIEPATIAKFGKHTKVWALHDFKVAQTSGDSTRKFLSKKGMLFFSCPDKTVGTKLELIYEGNMGSGQVLSNDQINLPLMLGILPGTVDEAIYEKVCRIRK